jgi:enamine deaminase RidA (YjgF/YER057c/UK114 family)
MLVERKLAEMGLTLPQATAAVATYASCVREGDLIYVSGHGPFDGGKPTYVGRVGAEFSESEGYAAARASVLAILSTLQAELGDLDRVDRVIKLLGFVSSANGFDRQPWVINGASDLLVSLYGERGRHARTAVGTSQLPLNIPVEIEMIVRVKD